MSSITKVLHKVEQRICLKLRIYINVAGLSPMLHQPLAWILFMDGLSPCSRKLKLYVSEPWGKKNLRLSVLVPKSQGSLKALGVTWPSEPHEISNRLKWEGWDRQNIRIHGDILMSTADALAPSLYMTTQKTNRTSERNVTLKERKAKNEADWTYRKSLPFANLLFTDLNICGAPHQQGGLGQAPPWLPLALHRPPASV